MNKIREKQIDDLINFIRFCNLQHRDDDGLCCNALYSKTGKYNGSNISPDSCNCGVKEEEIELRKMLCDLLTPSNH